MMVRGLFGHCAFMASRSDLIAGPQGWFLRFCSLACAAKRVNSPYFIQKLIDINIRLQIHSMKFICFEWTNSIFDCIFMLYQDLVMCS